MRDTKLLYEAVEKNNKYGFYELSKEYRRQMKDFYRDEYYQDDHALYNHKEYDELDMKQKRNHYSMKLYVFEKWGEAEHGCGFLDIGAGEGYALSFFDKKGWKVRGIDFSSYGIKEHNPSMLKYLCRGDFYSKVDDFKSKGMMFDFINADNVLEHLPNPETFFEEIKKVAHKGTVVCVTVPNDFSRVQQLAYDLGKIDDAFWVTKETSEHFSYFSVETICGLGKDAGFDKLIALSDWPIDFFLLNDSTNYIKNNAEGHNCHVACARLENALYEDSMEAAFNLFAALANAGIGRSVSVFFRL